MKKVDVLIAELETKINQQELLDETISKSSVGWHIEHTLLTINLIVDELIKSDPKTYNWTFNFTRTLVFTMNRIPRGRARSPKVVIPENTFTAETLQIHIEKTKAHLKRIQSLEPAAYFTHPYFGKLKLKPTIKFLEIHTGHHISIIRDIIGRTKRT